MVCSQQLIAVVVDEVDGIIKTLDGVYEQDGFADLVSEKASTPTLDCQFRVIHNTCVAVMLTSWSPPELLGSTLVR